MGTHITIGQHVLYPDASSVTQPSYTIKHEFYLPVRVCVFEPQCSVLQRKLPNPDTLMMCMYLKIKMSL